MNIKDIAKMAGVGVGTVSRVLNNHPNVKESTRKKVMDVINEINYIPNKSAVNLKKNSVNSNSIGVLIRGVFTPFFYEMVTIINKILSTDGYNIVLRQNDFVEAGDNEVRRVISLCKSVNLKGLIYLGCDIDIISDETFKDVEVPLVLVSPNKSYVDDNITNFSSVCINQVDSSKIATKYLVEKGAKNIGIILGANDNSMISSQRFLGYKKTLLENNLKFKEENVAYGSYTAEGAYEATIELLKRGQNIDGIFCTSDIMATGCAKAIIDSGFEVGKDIFLSGFDGMDIAKFYNPTITTVIQPIEEMAEIGANMIIDLIKNKSSHRHIELKTELSKGKS
ncbi:LacI family DNA-binding transcriptional regulator [uncultured Clostridium sp.]|uniref:LacI family DNA-binding transcriptional regulator n=1 Tax=uncultured Clostridium sp. TaxID=59620 RepID=UPI00262F17A8|nr:LacI family DNA-binding transcriptional regulator [uncultured Clostridium sp.]